MRTGARLNEISGQRNDDVNGGGLSPDWGSSNPYSRPPSPLVSIHERNLCESTTTSALKRSRSATRRFRKESTFTRGSLRPPRSPAFYPPWFHRNLLGRPTDRLRLAHSGEGGIRESPAEKPHRFPALSRRGAVAPQRVTQCKMKSSSTSTPVRPGWRCWNARSCPPTPSSS